MCNDHIGEQCYRSLSARSSISPVILGTQQYQTPLPISLDINWHTPTACADPEKCSRGKDKCALTVHEPLPNHCSSTTHPLPNVTTFLLYLIHHQCICSTTHIISSVCPPPLSPPMSSLDVPPVWVYITTPSPLNVCPECTFRGI